MFRYFPQVVAVQMCDNPFQVKPEGQTYTEFYFSLTTKKCISFRNCDNDLQWPDVWRISQSDYRDNILHKLDMFRTQSPKKKLDYAHFPLRN
jgi:hypothetical protein